MQTATAEFIVIWENGRTTLNSNDEISHMFDLADCNACDGVVAVYAVNDKNELVKIRLGQIDRDPDYDPESGDTRIYAQSPIFATNRRVGTVYWTDH